VNCQQNIQTGETGFGPDAQPKASAASSAMKKLGQNLMPIAAASVQWKPRAANLILCGRRIVTGKQTGSAIGGAS
jgi:hypothetical protein